MYDKNKLMRHKMYRKLDSPIECFHSPTWPAGMQISGPNERFMEKVLRPQM